MNKSIEAGEIFNREYKYANNFMTPNLIRYGFINRFIVYELSQGKGINHEDIFGLTLVSIGRDNKTHRSEKSRLCMSLKIAEEYIEELTEEFKNQI